jgi:hypothetical protein
MFKMIGGDGQEYGPFSAEQLRQWIAEHRANGQTLVQAEGTQGWKPLSEFPEFAALLAEAASRQAYPLSDLSAPDPDASVARMPSFPSRDGTTEEGFRVAGFSVGDCLGHGWLLLRQHFLLMSGATLVVWGVLTAASFATCIGALAALVISGALHGGLLLLFLRLLRGEQATFGDLFCCFGPPFVPLMLAWMVIHLLSSIGMIFCVVPGLFLKAIWVFGLVLIVDKRMEFWPALELSRRAVLAQFLPVAGLLFVAYLPTLIFVGYSSFSMSRHLLEAFGGGLGNLDWSTLQKSLEPLAGKALRLELQQQVVILLNLPFAYAAVLHVYEQIFGKRPVA